jgi:hypothetical protein
MTGLGVTGWIVIALAGAVVLAIAVEACIWSRRHRESERQRVKPLQKRPVPLEFEELRLRPAAFECKEIRPRVLTHHCSAWGLYGTAIRPAVLGHDRLLPWWECIGRPVGSLCEIVHTLHYIVRRAARLPERPPRGAPAIRPSLPMRGWGSRQALEGHHRRNRGPRRAEASSLPPLRASAPALANISKFERASIACGSSAAADVFNARHKRLCALARLCSS